MADHKHKPKSSATRAPKRKSATPPKSKPAKTPKRSVDAATVLRIITKARTGDPDYQAIAKSLINPDVNKNVIAARVKSTENAKKKKETSKRKPLSKGRPAAAKRKKK